MNIFPVVSYFRTPRISGRLSVLFAMPEEVLHSKKNQRAAIRDQGIVSLFEVCLTVGNII